MTGCVTGSEGLPRMWTPASMEHPQDDPVIGALAAKVEADWCFPEGQRSFRKLKHDGAGPDVREIVAMRHDTPMGKGGGYAQVRFGGRSDVVYLRSEGVFAVIVPQASIPETVGVSARGRRLDAIVDVPGIGHWIIRRIDREGDEPECNIILMPIAPEGHPRETRT